MRLAASILSLLLVACVATRAASLAFLAISRMLAPISSAPVATVWTLRLTSSDAADTTLAWADVSSALAPIWWLTAVSSSDELASAWALLAIAPMLALRSVNSFCSPSPI